jgi:hypothetical protein
MAYIEKPRIQGFVLIRPSHRYQDWLALVVGIGLLVSLMWPGWL